MEEIQLKDICDLDNGYAFKSDDYVDNSNTLNCRMSNIRPDGSFDILYSAKYLPDEFAEKYKDYILHDGDLIIAMTDMAGDPKILGVPTVVDTQGFCLLLNQRVGRLRFIRDGVNADYLKLALQCPKVRTYLKRFAGGGVQLNVSKKDILSAPVCMRNEEEQNHIAGLFKRVLEVKTKREQELQLLDDLIKARFVEMFGNKGENPNGYEEDTLGNLYKFQYGKGNNIPEDKGEYPCYGSNGIVGHHTEYNNEDSPIIGHIGAYAGIVNWGAGKHYVTYNGVMCKLKTDRVNPIYGFHLLQQQDFNRVATKGGGQPFVSYGDLEAPIVVVPPIEVQEAYAAFAEQVDKSKVVVKKSLDETQQLFDSLMQKYFG